MKCLSCNSDDLQAVVTIQRMLPLGARGGSIKVGGHNITQLEVKAEWDKHEVRGPIFCQSCATEHYYVTDAKVTLRVGSVDEARTVPIDDLRGLSE